MSNKENKVDIADISKKYIPSDAFISILKSSAEELYTNLLKFLEKHGYTDVVSYEHKTDGYIFARGTLPVCLCAHLDVVPSYAKIKSIKKTVLYNNKEEKKIIDVHLHSKQGIGGDDRCGVYAIVKMISEGHRPSVLFCMGEEIGCCGSRQFCRDYKADFLNGINAFIQIDRRNKTDVVRYSDANPALTDAVCRFGYSHAMGSCSDISQLMPHFGISGVNISSGYHHEHCKDREYISMSEVRYLLSNLNKMLRSDIFSKKYEYKNGYTYHSSYFSWCNYSSSNSNSNSYEQLSLLGNDEGQDFGVCEMCGEMTEHEDLVQTDEPLMDFVCPQCAELLMSDGDHIRCPSCGAILRKSHYKDDASFEVHNCPYCGGEVDENNND